MSLMSIVYFMLMIVSVLISMAFLTLLERKVLGYIQLRKGPNKVGYLGVLQPFSDAVKLFLSERENPYLSNYYLYVMCPMMGLILSLVMWVIFPFYTYFMSFDFGLVFFMSCLSVSVYSVMLAGWSSNSNYAILGSIRAVAQTISYEVSLALILLSYVSMVNGFDVLMFFYYQDNMWFLVFNLPLGVVWMSSMMAEMNRTPYDFAEGESELVSGFNVEYSGGLFAFIFMAEYVGILFMSFMVVSLNCGYFFLFLMIVVVSFVFIWIRGTVPRFRYDKLMYLSWKIYLPLSLNYLLFYVGFSVFMHGYVTM